MTPGKFLWFQSNLNSLYFISATSGGWSPWSTWSTCSRDCVRHKRRSCNDPKPSNGGPLCGGQNHDVEVCTGGLCTGNLPKYVTSIISEVYILSS